MEYKVIKKMDWDSDFFNISCGKALLETEEDIKKLINESVNYDFVSIQNKENKIYINKLIAENTNAFLADINIQFTKQLECRNEDNQCIVIRANEAVKKYNIEIDEDDFSHSKFIEDENFRVKNGYVVYREWIKNSKNADNKYFAMRFSETNEIQGFILFNIDKEIGTLELVKVNERYRGEGVCSQLIKKIENYLLSENVTNAHVGTQVNNIAAINLYHKLGYREISRTSVYHWWLRNK